MKDGQDKPKRQGWIDALKFVAIFAVLIDHTRGILYTNPIFAWLSYFSVSVFTLLAGVTAFYSCEKVGGGVF